MVVCFIQNLGISIVLFGGTFRLSTPENRNNERTDRRNFFTHPVTSQTPYAYHPQEGLYYLAVAVVARGSVIYVSFFLALLSL